ncbi:MAG TPA: hypothetical protein VFV36_06915, partial [Candidatus Methylomirabilis sp.]|nr:hypothetical protein [Candidatus Methylomirabilis sp.]
MACLAGILLAWAPEVRAQQPVSQQVLLSAKADGISAGGESTSPSLSDSGEVAAFQSTADDLHPEDRDQIPDIYLTSSAFPRPFLASVSSSPGSVKGDGASRLPSLSGDGVRVLFVSDARNLVPDDRNGFTDVFLRDIAAGMTERVSLSGAGTEGDDASDHGVLSRDGRFAAFSSRAGNLAGPQAPRGTSRIHLRNLAERATIRIDLPGGEPADADCLLPD